ncbi:MAG: TRAP-type mannitol/chloroaromatic compound transport system permease small subunit [Saprospiraceae bacterium]|jgi:TRAP-type mannitol/chloroaromatic compound transport system permease small subunit|tara:strand:- start:2763 stop:3311 length:549 start_codon:yes stop_codon:yes gene_type:complete
MSHKFTYRFESLSLGIDHFTERTGCAVAWLTLAMVTLTCVIVSMRYFFGTGSIALQESVTYMHALVFLMGAAFTLKRKGHVSVDIFYQRFTPRLQALIEILGTLFFLFPVCFVILTFSWDYVLSSWVTAESSSEASGLPWLYLLKTLLLLMPITMMLQGISEVIKNTLFLADSRPLNPQGNL